MEQAPRTLLISSILVLVSIYMQLFGPMNPGATAGIIAANFAMLAGMLLFLGDLYGRREKPIREVVPYVLITLIPLVSIVYASVYYARISSGHISGAYHTFSLSALFLVATTLGLGRGQDKYNPLMYATSALSIVLLVTQGVVLAYYSTDG